MVTQEEAEKVAIDHVQRYVNACRCDTDQDVGNALLKLLSVVAVSIAAVHGKETAIDMLAGTSQFISKQRGQWQKHTIQ